ncbi:MAG: putative lipid II flippase FtsW [Patescibacteria group bacterium]
MKTVRKNTWLRSIFGEQSGGKPDYLLAVLVFALVIFGLIMVSSVSVVVSYDTFGDSHRFLRDQFVSALIGLVAFFVVSKIDYTFWKRNAIFMLIGTLLLLIMVFIPGLSFEYGGAKRWILIGPLFFQPSEIIKLTFLFYLSAWLAKKGELVQNFSMGFLPFVFLMVLVTGLIMMQPDLGTMLVIAAMSGALFFVSGANLKHIFLIIVGSLGAVWLLIISAPYRMARLTAFLNPEENILGIGYHVQQALVAIGSGGWLGRGFGRSLQKYAYLPEVSGDSIFAIMAEELGFIRISLFLAVYIFFLSRGILIAKKAPDVFGKLLALGIVTWFGFQAFVNISAMLSLLPLTGLPLPFISYGGSSLVISLIAVGVLYNISKKARI